MNFLEGESPTLILKLWRSNSSTGKQIITHIDQSLKK